MQHCSPTAWNSSSTTPSSGSASRAGARSVQKFDWGRSGELLETFLERYIADPEHYQQAPGEDRSKDYTL